MRQPHTQRGATQLISNTQMLCHPQNPFGQCYNKETLLAYAIFAEKHNLHLISDELYALSIYDNPGELLSVPVDRHAHGRPPRPPGLHFHALPGR